MNNLLKKKALHLFFLFCLFCNASHTFAQCSNPYNLYPVSFDFEANGGAWVAGGANSDWTWGHPSKPVIGGAAGGQNCWVTGGLTGSQYNGNEGSWLQSPKCFDFSNLAYPYIEFKVFWEMEKKYDGAGFQYSTDYGATWKNVGALGDNSNCMNKNWFNYTPVINLPGSAGPKDGWSGNIQPTVGNCLGGGGSGTWVTARHTLYNLAGQTHVMFRFTFGSGSTCNDFDGFAVDDIVINNTPPGPVITYTNLSNVICNGTPTGSAVAGANYGVTPYTYTWTHGADTYTGSSVHYLPVGDYKLVVSDDNNCTDSYQFTLTEPSALLHTLTSKDATCGLSNGSLSVAETGGVPPYTYSWSPNVSASNSASGLAPAYYTVTVTDKNNCTDVIQVDIVNKGGISAGTGSVSNATCYDASNGSATVNVTGSGTFTYLWSPAGGSGATANNLAAGDYSVLVTDEIGCTADATAHITAPPEIAAVIIKQDVTCNNNNGTAGVSVSGGKGPYTYLWLPGNYTTANIAGLAPDTYTLTVTDANGCNKTQPVIINALAAPKIAAINHTDAVCYGQSNGTVNAIANSGTVPYTYKWTDGVKSYNGDGVQGLKAGNYDLTITDANGCTAAGSVTVSEPLQLSHSVNTLPVTCTNVTGSATISETGGTAPYSYSWLPAGGNSSAATGLPVGDYIVRVNDAHQCLDSAAVQIISTSGVTATISSVTNATCKGGINGAASVTASGSGPFKYAWFPSGSNTASVSNLAAGSYTVSVTDANGCIAQAIAKIEEPEAIAVQIARVNTACGNSNGSATVTATGGTGLYSYQWSPINATTITIASLPAATYSVTVTDANGCPATNSVIIEASTPPKVSSITVTDILCNSLETGSAVANVSNGTLPYMYTWTKDASSYTGNPLQNAGAGTYHLTVTDAAGCTASGDVMLKEPTSLAHATTTAMATCGKPNGSATVIESGGTAPYMYSWSAAGGSNSSAAALAPGDYIIQIKDNNLCTDTAHIK